MDDRNKEAPQLIEVRVLVPARRETEFYRWFADWRDEAPTDSVSSDSLVAESELEAAAKWWKTLTKKERALWNIWVESAPGLVAADRIVEELHLKSTRAIPGILSWPTRKARRVGFRARWTFDANDGSPLYGIEDPEYADLLQRARASLQGDF